MGRSSRFIALCLRRSLLTSRKVEGCIALTMANYMNTTCLECEYKTENEKKIICDGRET